MIIPWAPEVSAVFASEYLRLVQAIRALIIRFRLGRLRGDAISSVAAGLALALRIR
jgi:hypothetical protein